MRSDRHSFCVRESMSPPVINRYSAISLSFSLSLSLLFSLSSFPVTRPCIEKAFPSLWRLYHPYLKLQRLHRAMEKLIQQDPARLYRVTPGSTAGMSTPDKCAPRDLPRVGSAGSVCEAGDRSSQVSLINQGKGVL